MARTPKRRKPRRKRLIVNATQPNDIPYSKFRIEWIDIVSDSGWASDKEFNRMKLATPVNEGWVYSKDKNTVKDGGQTEFVYQKLRIRPEIGLTLIWGSDWPFTHRGITSPTETKYIATGLYSYEK